jgi:hypothetical protein
MNLDGELETAMKQMAEYLALDEQHKEEVESGRWGRGEDFEGVVSFLVQNRMDRYDLAGYITQLIRMGRQNPALFQEYGEEQLERIREMAQEQLQTSSQSLLNIIRKLGHSVGR